MLLEATSMSGCNHPLCRRCSRTRFSRDFCLFYIALEASHCRFGINNVRRQEHEGWNQIQFNLSDFTRRAYGTNYIETLRVQIHANCRIRRIYFSDRLYSEEELPPEFKLFLPVPKANNASSSEQQKATTAPNEQLM
ncbi:Transcription factor IIB [Plasmopara halstedii]|uniref:Transcription factor IIB n=1 Tax=Plasmopara halstedii TaxID=4781 RepID=A0A0P1AQS5_PLAHL|nr:Transcription factor IIB [Plasmopara halstedii]CEG43482.1 Transcription factor IIB [Plasmopara halstedii]|eukprot:XP_024579851.1 Transcription factor IIB [Plasmopara halstedii]